MYHVETEAHEVLLANGAPCESFVDYSGRGSFDNLADYMARHGTERTIPEMGLPRIASWRLLPDAIRRRIEENAGGAVALRA